MLTLTQPRCRTFPSPFHSPPWAPCPPPTLSLLPATTNLFYIPIMNYMSSRLSCKWNYMACKPLGLTFFTRHNSLKDCCVNRYLVPFCWWIGFHSKDAPWFIRRWKASGVLPGFACYESNYYEHLCTGFCMNTSFHSYVQECNFWVIW